MNLDLMKINFPGLTIYPHNYSQKSEYQKRLNSILHLSDMNHNELPDRAVMKTKRKVVKYFSDLNSYIHSQLHIFYA